MIRFIGSQSTAVALLLCLSSAPAFAEEPASEPDIRSASEARAAHLVNQLAAEQHLQTQMQ